MIRTKYFNYIEGKLLVLASRIETRGKLNILDFHLHSENFYLHLFNLLYGYELKNLNSVTQNVEAIDLVDDNEKVFIQVSSTCTKQKLESTLSKKILKNYKNYTFKFISISKDAADLRKKKIKNPYCINFNPSIDIYDIKSILEDVMSLKAREMKKIYEFIQEELGEEINIIKLDSNLATIINILAEEDWSDENGDENFNSFEIERKIEYNDLDDAKDLIEEFKIFYKKVDEKYTEFDLQGSNKSNSVLSTIRREYRKLKKIKDKDSLFFEVIEKVKEKVLTSSNLDQIPIDEIELCVDIIVVDAFIRCKIFENPNNYQYAIT